MVVVVDLEIKHNFNILLGILSDCLVPQGEGYR